MQIKFKQELNLMIKKYAHKIIVKSKFKCRLMLFLKLKVKYRMIKKVHKIYFSFINLWIIIWTRNKAKSILFGLNRQTILAMDM